MTACIRGTASIGLGLKLVGKMLKLGVKAEDRVLKSLDLLLLGVELLTESLAGHIALTHFLVHYFASAAFCSPASMILYARCNVSIIFPNV